MQTQNSIRQVILLFIRDVLAKRPQETCWFIVSFAILAAFFVWLFSASHPGRCFCLAGSNAEKRLSDCLALLFLVSQTESELSILVSVLFALRDLLSLINSNPMAVAELVLRFLVVLNEEVAMPDEFRTEQERARNQQIVCTIFSSFLNLSLYFAFFTIT